MGVSKIKTFTDTVRKKKTNTFIGTSKKLRHITKQVMGNTCPHKRWELEETKESQLLKSSKKASLKFEARDNLQRINHIMPSNENIQGKKRKKRFFCSHENKREHKFTLECGER